MNQVKALEDWSAWADGSEAPEGPAPEGPAPEGPAPEGPDPAQEQATTEDTETPLTLEEAVSSKKPRGRRVIFIPGYTLCRSARLPEDSNN